MEAELMDKEKGKLTADSEAGLKAKLIRAALEARANAYAPYSGFRVGAAVLASSGRIYKGVNVENASYPCGICAERSAISHAISEGERSIKAVALVGASAETVNNAASEGSTASEGPAEGSSEYCPPCGICRQFMREFADPAELQIISAKSADDYRQWTLEELLPQSFGPDSLL
jgi:cytidine deaminase